MHCIWVALLCIGFACGQATFDVAVIKPAAPLELGRTSVHKSVTKEKGIKGRLSYQGISLMDLIADAYLIQHRQISGPDWLASQRFDILASIPADQANNQIPEMLKALLQERFSLKTHDEMKETQVYRLLVAKVGPKLEKVEKETGISGKSTKTTEQIHAQTTLTSFAEYLSDRLNRPVIDETSLTGRYSIQLAWTPDTAVATESDPTGASLFSAVQEQLGLRLVSGKMNARLLVVDSINKHPTEN